MIERDSDVTMRLAVLNANKGLYNTDRRKRLISWLEQTSADVLLLIEPWAACREPIRAVGPLQVVSGNCWVAAYARPGYSLRRKLIEDRWLCVDLGNLRLHAVYFPSKKSEAGDRVAMLKRLQSSIQKQPSRRHLVTGDLNMAPTPEDGLHGGRASEWTTDGERTALEELLSGGNLVDSTRRATNASRFTFERSIAGLPSQFRCDLALVDRRLLRPEGVFVRVDHTGRNGAKAFTDHSALVIDCEAKLVAEPEAARSSAETTPLHISSRITFAPWNTAIKRGRASTPTREFANEYLRPRKHRILDFGCGFGDDVDWLRTQGFRVVGLDPSPRRHEFSVTPDGVFDAVLLVYVVNVLPPKERMNALISAWSFVKPGGRLLVAARSRTLHEEARRRRWQPHEDGYIADARRRTFQKGFSVEELFEFCGRLEPIKLPQTGVGRSTSYSAVVVTKRATE